MFEEESEKRNEGSAVALSRARNAPFNSDFVFFAVTSVTLGVK